MQLFVWLESLQTLNVRFGRLALKLKLIDEKIIVRISHCKCNYVIFGGPRIFSLLKYVCLLCWNRSPIFVTGLPDVRRLLSNVLVHFFSQPDHGLSPHPQRQKKEKLGPSAKYWKFVLATLTCPFPNCPLSVCAISSNGRVSKDNCCCRWFPMRRQNALIFSHLFSACWEIMRGRK